MFARYSVRCSQAFQGAYSEIAKSKFCARDLKEQLAVSMATICGPTGLSVDNENPASRMPSAAVIDLTIRLGILAALAYWSLLLVRPFLTVALWSIVLAIALFPVFDWLAARLGGRRGLAAVLITALNLLIVFGSHRFETRGGFRSTSRRNDPQRLARGYRHFTVAGTAGRNRLDGGRRTQRRPHYIRRLAPRHYSNRSNGHFSSRDRVELDRDGHNDSACFHGLYAAG